MKRKQKRALGKVLAYVFQISLALIFVLPLVWMIVSSLKPEADLFKDMSSIATFFVSNPSLDNYKEMFSRSLVLKSTINSMIYIGLILLIGIPVNALCGYALARLKFPGKNFILSAIIALYIVPFETVVLPLYLVSNTLKITNTFFALFIPFIANCFNIFLFRQFFMSLPKELEEAASIDGCGVLGTFIRVVLPNTKPVIVTATVLTLSNHRDRYSSYSIESLKIKNEFIVFKI